VGCNLILQRCQIYEPYNIVYYMIAIVFVLVLFYGNIEFPNNTVNALTRKLLNYLLISLYQL